MTAFNITPDSFPWQGKVRTTGSPGPAGENAYTTTTASYTQPAVGANVTVSVENSDWIAPLQIIYQDAGGYYQAISFPSSTQVVLKNLGYPQNAVAGVNIPSGGAVSPGGFQGPAGPFASSFGVLLSTTSGGAEVFVGLAGSNADPANVAGRTVDDAINFTSVYAAISPGVYVAPAPVYRIKLYRSTDGGISYSFLTGATIDLNVGSSNKGSASFSAVSLAAGSVHLIGVQQLSGGSNTTNAPLSVTWS